MQCQHDMATAGSVLSKEQLLCPICLDLFNQPVSTPCGHNFCKECLQRYWQSSNIPQCPMCKHKLYMRPDLKVNTFISEVASQFKELVENKNENESSTTDQSEGHKAEVSCDVCIGKRVRALKSCLDCLASFCETHLEPHYVLGTFKKHHLIKPMMNMQDRVCKKHEKLLDSFCNTDQLYVCQICIKKDHTAHHTVLIEDESRDRRAQIGGTKKEAGEMIHRRLQKICDINKLIQLSRRNTERESEESLQVFNKLLQIVQRGQAEVAEVIGVKQKQVESMASRLILELEQEIDQLRHWSDELEQLSFTDDDLYLLQCFPAFSAMPATKEWSNTCVDSAEYVGIVRRAVRRVMCQLEEIAKAEVKMLCETEFQRAHQYAVDVHLDPDTAHPKLVLSENKKQVYHGDVSLSLPDNPERRPLSPVLTAVVWTLLSCGILLAFCFLLFTLRFKNNRIVKMSSPNLNALTLFGSVLTYSSGFLFAIDEGGASIAVLQARMWTLCVGSTLVFGPILGKTWRLYRVFTQRVPDKRVIIRDIQLMGMVALLILVDMLILTAWNLTDPIRCSRSAGAVVKVMERDVSYSLSQLYSCSSLYSNLWVIIIAIQKGCLFLYGTYLAGLTSNVSHPPVNQSPTIITSVTLVTCSSAVAVPVSIFLQTWPNLVYSTVAGAIFICTLATNCMLFVPQLTQWRQFEEDQNNPSQMAKYFSSPSKSQPSVYSQDEIFYLLGENNSMKKLLNEKNAVIDSLQEQVNNAKDKLLRLMSASQHPDDQDTDSSATNLNSSSTHTTELQSEGPSSWSQNDTKSALSPPALSPHLTVAHLTGSLSAVTPSSEPSSVPNSSAPISVSSPLPTKIPACETQNDESALKQDVSLPVMSLLRTADETVQFVTALQSRRGLNPSKVETFGSHTDLTLQLGPNTKPASFISSEQLQEILQELSMDAVMETTLRSPGQVPRIPSQQKLSRDSILSPLSPRTPCSPPPPALFRYPSISPYTMRKRRRLLHSSRGGLAAPCFYTGSENPGYRRTRDTCELQNPDDITVDDNCLPVQNSDLEVEKEGEDAEGHEVIRTCQRCVSRLRRCSVLHREEQNHTSPEDVGTGGDNEQHRRHIRDSCGYSDSDSSSSTDYCYYHRPYCDSCLQRGSLLYSDSSSESSDSEYDGYMSLYRSPRPVVFKEDLKPTFV
ncbi:probable G-protein coupled receptor 156 [Archocentrus centrarchus]|uniref:probable G-protein coupled receptor 156 n=1 Tax=Archocentrus centrarchus TaxID=63155 RepID=UPI0011E9F87C|nr:probable G-protein coupled receptor 156 [Archocentrus centrarchus]